MSRLLPGLVLPAAARDAGALYQHIPSLDVLQAADVAASRRSGSRTRGGRDLRPSGVATTLLGSSPNQNFDEGNDGGCGRTENHWKRLSRAIRSVSRVARASRGRIPELGTDAKGKGQREGTRRGSTSDKGDFVTRRRRP